MFFTCAFVLFFLYKSGNLNFLIRYKKLLTCIFFAFGLLLILLFIKSNLFYTQVTRGFDNNGRDVILEKRLPILLNSGRAYIGLGFGGDQYVKFLNDNNPQGLDLGPSAVINGEIRYWHDEPVFIGQYYHYGVIGTILFIFMVFYMIFTGVAKFKENNRLYLGVCSSILSVYVIRGLFETFDFTHLFVMIGFFIAFKTKAL